MTSFFAPDWFRTKNEDVELEKLLKEGMVNTKLLIGLIYIDCLII